MGRKHLESYDELKANIRRYLESQGLENQLATQVLDSLAQQSSPQKTVEEILDEETERLCAKDNELKYLVQEYHDGLLLYEISNKLVWDKAAKDDSGLANFFKKNKKRYEWDEPRFKGMAFHVKDEADVQAVKDCVKKLPFDKWAEKLRSTFNNDSVLRIRVEKGIFKKGDNALVDSVIFKKDTTVTKVKDYPIDGVYGKVLKKRPEDYTDVRGLVVADYQEALEKEWVAELRKKYLFTVNKEVLETVNKH
jgi:peptidyl-prolyl cis-trans isomerase SurA